MPIHFGTDGWRAVISDTFTFHNLRLVTQAIADAVAGMTPRSIQKAAPALRLAGLEAFNVAG